MNKLVADVKAQLANADAELQLVKGQLNDERCVSFLAPFPALPFSALPVPVFHILSPILSPSISFLFPHFQPNPYAQKPSSRGKRDVTQGIRVRESLV